MYFQNSPISRPPLIFGILLSLCSLLPALTQAELLNFSVRGLVMEEGPAQLSGGFVVGPQGARVLLRSGGPSLKEAGIADVAEDPRLLVYAGPTLIAANDDWVDGPEAAEIEAAGLAPGHVYESALMETLAPGPYNAFVRDDNQGVGSAGMFKLEGAPNAILNFSGRGYAGRGRESLIVGFIVVDTPSRVLIRARGPSLSDAGVLGEVLMDPRIILYADNEPIAANDDWGEDSEADTIMSLGLAPSDARESALLRTLDPGRYAVLLEGQAPGIAVVGLTDLDHSRYPPR